jgi:sigma-B regulation protein RsbQ
VRRGKTPALAGALVLRIHRRAHRAGYFQSMTQDSPLPPHPVVRRNNVRVFGNGTQPMMFAHGFGCDQNMWRLVTPAFENDFRIVLFDYVGAGRSDLSAYDSGRYSRLEGYAEDILEICRALSLEDVILIGHSVSSMIAALAAIADPDRFASVIMVGPSPRYINDTDYVGGFDKRDIEELLDTMERNYIGWANFLAPVLMQNADRPELTQELTESFCSTDPRVARRFAEVTFFSDNRDDLAKVPVPVLVMQCSEDLIAPTSVGEYVARNVPRADLRMLRATGHCPHMSHPEETAQVIREFLAR